MIDQLALRGALGQFATGLCVVTANPPGYAPFGITVNSFASVSLDPALVLWSLRKDSECMAAFAAAKRYTINVLSRDQLLLANRYADKDQHDLVAAHYRIGKTGSPVLRNALSSFECEIWQRYDGGDHEILVGSVLEICSRPTGTPLIYHASQYRELR